MFLKLVDEEEVAGFKLSFDISVFCVCLFWFSPGILLLTGIFGFSNVFLLFRLYCFYILKAEITFKLSLGGICLNSSNL